MTGKGCKDLTKLEKGILELLQKHMAKIGFFTLLFFSMLLRWVLLPYGSNDFLDFLRPWYEEIRASGGMTALKNEIGDYNYLYRFLLAVFSYIPNPMIAVKLLSLLFDYIGAAGGAFLVGRFWLIHRLSRFHRGASMPAQRQLHCCFVPRYC